MCGTRNLLLYLRKCTHSLKKWEGTVEATGRALWRALGGHWEGTAKSLGKPPGGYWEATVQILHNAFAMASPDDTICRAGKRLLRNELWVTPFNNYVQVQHNLSIPFILCSWHSHVQE